MMGKPGMTVSRWIDGVLEKNDLIDQDSNLRGLIFWGHAPNSQSRGAEMKKAMDKLDLLVVIDPYPSASAAMAAMPAQPRTAIRTARSICCRRRRSSRPRGR
jgi:formate dehydrogenase major subunit